MPRLLTTTVALLLFMVGPLPAADFDLAPATNQLGLQLYRTLAAANPSGNLVLSPYSIESALALVYAGADGATRSEMAGVLGFPADDESVHPAVATLRTALDQIVTQSKTAADQRARHGGRIDPIEWHAANRLFGQQGYGFRPAFLTLMKDRYAAPFEPMPFRDDPDGSRLKINRWVTEQTRQKINELIPYGALKTDTRLVLVNALYLKAPWETPFEKSATRPQPFHPAAGPERSVSTMQRTAFLGHTHENGLTVVTLDYVSRGLQFVILLPDAGSTPDTIAAQLTPADFTRWAKLGDGKRPNIALSLPKFRLEGSTVPLGPVLRTLGLRSAFDVPAGSANFDRIAPRKSNDYLALSEVFHQTFIAVDEEGTEAAAATAALMLALGAVMPQEPIEVRVDRPFLFAIQHRASGACLFLGRISDPR
jgi:serpin B